jgi:hypothetical protein
MGCKGNLFEILDHIIQFVAILVMDDISTRNVISGVSGQPDEVRSGNVPLLESIPHSHMAAAIDMLPTPPIRSIFAISTAISGVLVACHVAPPIRKITTWLDNKIPYCSS